MSALIISAIGQARRDALAKLDYVPTWPDPASGFAYRLLKTAGQPSPQAFEASPRSISPELLRRAPELGAFGYVVTACPEPVQRDWTLAFDRLMGRDIYPPDRNSFVHNPVELIGIALGVGECALATAAQQQWLVDTIALGFRNHQFTDRIAQAAATVAARILDPSGASVGQSSSSQPLADLENDELLGLFALAQFAPAPAFIDGIDAENEIAQRVLATGVPIDGHDGAASLYLALDHFLARISLAASASGNPTTKIVALCRRFPLFVERLQTRQRHREPLSVSDEYDVQDLLHAILKLHFDDLRPEEWTPSYASTSSRTDFLPPREKVIIEAKMTRSGLGQREVADQLIIDVARYSKMQNVDHLICVVYDPGRRCANPTALEDDVAQTEGRLQVSVVVCPQGI